MTDQQFQPGQTNPPTQQGWWVFGGDPENNLNDPFLFWSLNEPEKTDKDESVSTEKTTVDGLSVPFDEYVMPENIDTKQETTVEENQINEQELENISIEETPIEEVVEDIVEETQIEDEITIEKDPIEEITIEDETLAEKGSFEEVPVEELIVEDSIEDNELEEDVNDDKTEESSDVQQKFTNLFDNISELNWFLHKKDGEVLEIIWSNSDKLSVLYQFGINDQKEIRVKRIETDKENDENNFNELKLWLNSESNLFEIFLDEVLLFEEDDIMRDSKKKSQVMEKLNKFIFLTESKLKDTQKEMKVKKEEEEERRRLQDIFRNF